MLFNCFQELTYGVKITWQEGHLSYLVKTLVKCVENNELISVALGVLVNICYKNIPAVYTLMQCIDTKMLIKSILRKQGDRMDIRVQVCIFILTKHKQYYCIMNVLVQNIFSIFKKLKIKFVCNN